MLGRKFELRWTLILAAAALAAVFTVLVSRNSGEAPARTHVAAQPELVSETLGATDVRGLRDPAGTAPAPSLEQSLVAADLLVKAGKLPTLAESLRAADLLVRAGKLEAPPTLAETLQAADILVKAGEMEAPPPSLLDSLQAADALAKAGVITPPPPPLVDILRAASLLADAKAKQNQPAPQAVAPTDTPEPPAPTSTPVPPTPKPAPPTKTPVTPTVEPEPVEPVVVDDPGFDSDFTAQVFAEVNKRRKAAGLGLLTVEPRLANSAAAYAKMLADYNWFSHTGPDGSTLVTRDEAAGFPFTVQLGEVLAWGSNGWTPAEIVQAWIDSPAHRDQILASVYTRAGAGCYFTEEDTIMVRCVMELAAAD